MESIMVLFYYVYGILVIWGKWTVFRRMGIMGIWSVVPVYSDYLIYQKVWNKGWCGVLASLMYYYGLLMLGKTFMSWFDWITGILALFLFGFVMNAVTMHRLSQLFKAPSHLRLGMTVLWPVFMILMAGDQTLHYHPELVQEPEEYFHWQDRR